MAFVFFKQKTAYEMRISDWSSDVCSSDLLPTQACRSASSTRVVGTTFACASAMTRAMLRRTPLSCSGWPLTDTPGGWVRIGLPEVETLVRSDSYILPPAGEGAPRSGADEGAPATADPSVEACSPSAMVTVPSEIGRAH